MRKVRPAAPHPWGCRCHRLLPPPPASTFVRLLGEGIQERTCSPLLVPAEAAKLSLQASLDKLKQDNDAIQKDLDAMKASQDARAKEVETLTQQLKECQDKSGGDLRQKVCALALESGSTRCIC
jgi:FtsZ-binding cell division protein ZapB